jgi:Protein of unknown function (DUF559)/Transcriptional regulator, AbiEi antitoxin
VRHVIGDIADDQLGVVSFAQLETSGLSRRQIERSLESGLLERLHVGVFRVRGAPATHAQRLLAACLAIGPEAAASHRAAATMHGLLNYAKPPVEVTTNRLRSPEIESVVAHRLADLHDRWVVSMDGVRVTTVARTLVDLGAVASPATVEAALDRAAGRRLVTYRDARDAMRAVARQGRRGVGTIRRLLDARVGEVLPVGVLAARMATLLRDAGLPELVAEHLVTDMHGGFIAVVDFAFVDQRVAIEVDGYEFHSSPKAVAHDNARDRLLITAGWRPLHFSWSDVEHRPHRVVDEILGTLNHRRGG